MKASEVRQKYIEFFENKGHKRIPSASLVPVNDPTVIFTTAGMHPLVPYLLGQKHHLGTRLASVQKCLRTGDIEEVGDATHLTFFEMLGNWSLGDYWKEDAIKWSYEFLTSSEWLGLNVRNLAITVFAGDADAPRDEESADIWKGLGISPDRIAYLDKEDNWWGPAGMTGPCGPDTEMFYWTGEGEAPAKFNPKDTRWVEIWNDVFMQYNKTAEGKFEPLTQKNVDTGMGLERTAAVMQGKKSVYETELFQPVLDGIRGLADKSDIKAERIIADHLRSATFVIADGVVPSNKDRGYVLRRLIRRAVTYGKKLGIDKNFSKDVAAKVIDLMSGEYPELIENRARIFEELDAEEIRFREALIKGLKLLDGNNKMTGKEAFDLYQSYGFPPEMIEEELSARGIDFDKKEFEEEFKKHQELSRTASAGAFKGGLADHTEKIVRLHTATHLMNAALRKVLGDGVWQKGSNITEERTRFDFTHGEKMTEAQKSEVEKIVNEAIARDYEVKKEIMPLTEARQLGAIGVFGEKYPDTVSVYTVWDQKSGEVFSREFCGGPHVTRTGEIGKFGIIKEEAVAAGIRRIKAGVEDGR